MAQIVVSNAQPGGDTITRKAPGPGARDKTPWVLFGVKATWCSGLL
jgi:hypothetical protein